MENFGFKENRILRLLPGFRFHPTDEELVVCYLIPKIQSLPLPYPIPEADVCKFDPWNLPGDLEQEKYFFSTVQTKHPNSNRCDRKAPSGYWKPSGIDRNVFDSGNNLVGTKKSLVFYLSKPPNGIKTYWIMHEYKIVNPTQGLQKWTICKVFKNKRARNDDIEEEEMAQVISSISFEGDLGNTYLSLDGGGSSISGLGGVKDAGEDEENSK